MKANRINALDLNQMVQINASIECILKSTVSVQNSDSIYFWDVLNPVIKFALLNQTQVLALSFDIQQAINNNVDNLNWTNIPEEVQTLLVQQQSSLLYLKFSDWGWADLDVTLNSMLSEQGKFMLASLEPLLQLLAFDLIIDLNKLKGILYGTNQPFHHEIRPYHHMMQHFNKIDPKEYESYFDIVKMFFKNFFSYFKPWFAGSLDLKSKKGTAANIFANSIHRIHLFLNNYNL